MSASDDLRSPPQHGQLFGLVRLPGVTPAFEQSARGFVRHSACLLHMVDAILLSATIHPQLPNERVTVMPWDRCLNPRPDLVQLLGQDTTAKALSDLEREALFVLAELATRWPPNAAPSLIGIVTDGTGVAFSSEHPSPLAPNWLLHHASSQTSATIIIDFAASSMWQQLQARNASIH